MHRNMADDVDMCQARDESVQQHLLSFRFPTLNATGFCYFCDEPVSKGNFCDPDCRDDFAKQEYMASQRPL